MTQPVPASSSGTVCTDCGEPALVVWQRRLTDVEFTEYTALDFERRERALLLADPQQPAPDLGPLPDAGNCMVPVYACGPHAITLDAASLVHAKDCTAPNTADLPGCDCTPEPAPTAEPDPEQESARLPAHWVQ